jgi:hypothetical protein
MLQVRSILLQGEGVDDAVVSFVDGVNVLAGASDTGKSYLVHCLNYIFGAEEMTKRFHLSEPYSQLFVELQNAEGDFLTLERSLSGGDISVYQSRMEDALRQVGEAVLVSRSGQSKAKDITSVLFEFSNIPEARLRKNNRGETQRLTVRTLLPTFLVDEVAMIDERSPVLGRLAFDATAKKRAFSYLLTGKDDQGVIAAERKEVVRARLNAQLSVISDLLSPIEARLKNRPASEDSVDRIDETIAALSQSLADRSEERSALETERQEAVSVLRKADSQIVAIDELLRQYKLLADRYQTDLERLDFIAEGAHFFDGLQEVACPLCDQPMSLDHAHIAAERSEPVYQSARAEAAKILALQEGLVAATNSLERRRTRWRAERDRCEAKVQEVDALVANSLVPEMQEMSQRLKVLVGRRVDLEAAINDEAQAASLRQMKESIEEAATGTGKTRKWEPLPSSALRNFCKEVETLLSDWNWKGEGRVEFDDSTYDIIVDGQARQSHGKGVRAVLYSAFVVALLRFCLANRLPHPGFVLIDSPLTSYKKGKNNGEADGPVSGDMEAGFWRWLANSKLDAQLIVIENKEPPAEVAGAVHYQWFGGVEAGPGERVGFIPKS